MIYLLLGLSFLGFLDAAYLSYIHATGPAACLTGSCERVLASQYSYQFGIPLSSIGMGVYAAFLFLTGSFLWAKQRPQRQQHALWWIQIISLVGSFISGYLVYLQGFVIGQWCLFCLLSAFIMGMVAIVAFILRRRDKDALPLLRFPGNQDLREVGLILSGFLLAVGIYWGAKLVLLNKEAQSTSMESEVAPQTVIAKIGEREIRMEELEKGMGTQLVELRQAVYEAQLEWLERQLLKAEAERQGLDIGQLIENLTQEQNIQVTEAEALTYYEAHSTQIPEEPWPQLLPKIQRYLMQKAVATALQVYIHRLKSDYGFESLLPRPQHFVIPPNPYGSAEKGPVDAPLTLIEFSDFECPHCSRAHWEVKELLKTYPGKIRSIFRHNPLESHQGARAKAIAAVCAQAQGSFWEYADKLFSDQSHASEATLIDNARSLGLDTEVFKACLDSDAAAEHVALDVAQVEQLGIKSAPVLFFNGELSVGFPRSRQLTRLLQEAGL